LTQTYFFSGISFNKTGEIGDTIGGISSPIIGVAGAYLVWLTFHQQNEYNKIQDKRFLGEKWYNDNIAFLKDIKKDYDELSLEMKLSDPIFPLEKLITLRRTRVLSPLVSYLENYENVPQIIRYDVDSYVYDFGFVIAKLNNLASIAISKSEVYKDESKDLLYQCSLFHDMYIKYTATKLIDNLNEKNDKENRREKIKSFLNYLESSLPSPPS